MTSYKRAVPVIILSLAMLVFWIVTEIRSAGREAIVDDVPELMFSRESGFYDDEFDLTIKSARGQIYYTLDSSEPTSDSIPYEGSIHISDATYNENVYSARTDISTGYYTDLINEYSWDPPMYQAPGYPVDKCTVVRAVACYEDGSYSAVKTSVYFVGFENRPGYDGVGYVSVVTDPYNLFDYYNGILVTGWVFDDYASDIENRPWNDTWFLWSANYSRESEAATERPANIQMFDPDGNLMLSQSCGLKVKGNGSRGYVSKSLNLYAREEYDGNDHFLYAPWNDGFYPARITVFSGGDDYVTKCRDYMMHMLCRDMDFATMDFIPYVMFLDGEYWGVYWLNEKYDAEYLSHRYNVDQDSVIMAKVSPRFEGIELEEGEETDADLYYEMMDFVSNADMTDEENFRTCFDKYLDYESTIDYYAAMLYVSRYFDWPGANFGLWRTRTIGDDEYSDGKWRWMLFDVNNEALTEDLTDYDPIAWAMQYGHFANLMNNEQFKTDLMNRIEQLAGAEFAQDKVDRVMNDYHRIMDGPMRVNNRRFWGTEDTDKYDDSLESLENFMRLRPEYIDEIVARYR